MPNMPRMITRAKNFRLISHVDPDTYISLEDSRVLLNHLKGPLGISSWGLKRTAQSAGLKVRELIAEIITAVDMVTANCL